MAGIASQQFSCWEGACGPGNPVTVPVHGKSKSQKWDLIGKWFCVVQRAVGVLDPVIRARHGDHWARPLFTPAFCR